MAKKKRTLRMSKAQFDFTVLLGCLHGGYGGGRTYETVPYNGDNVPWCLIGHYIEYATVDELNHDLSATVPRADEFWAKENDSVTSKDKRTSIDEYLRRLDEKYNIVLID